MKNVVIRLILMITAGIIGLCTEHVKSYIGVYNGICLAYFI